MDEPVLTTHNLSIGYGSPQRTHYDRAGPRLIATALNVCLRAGELVCLLGPNGVGKSTLMRTLAGMQPALAGEVRLAGTPISALRPHDLARRLSVVLTERVEVGQLSAYALVALGRHPYTDWLGRLTPDDETVVRRAIEAVGAVALAHRPVHELSDGERQRIMIARALAQDPVVLLLDEPTAFLDLPRRVELMHLLRHLARSSRQALLLSTHDLDLALRCADVLWLMTPDGTLLAGAPEDLVLNGAFAAAFRGEGVTFDVASGTFRLNAPTHGPVQLRGTGLPMQWTARALERAGFALATGPEPTQMRVTVLSDGDGPRWQSQIAGATYMHTSVYELITWLRGIVDGA